MIHEIIRRGYTPRLHPDGRRRTQTWISFKVAIVQDRGLNPSTRHYQRPSGSSGNPGGVISSADSSSSAFQFGFRILAIPAHCIPRRVPCTMANRVAVRIRRISAMASVCFYFQGPSAPPVAPLQRLRHRRHTTSTSQRNTQILKKVANKCYLPATRLILDLVRKPRRPASAWPTR